MTNEMGRKETRYLQTLNCDSMAQQNMKMRPVLLKRNSLDSADFLRHPQHRRTKSQQVRFKEDGVSTKAELEAHPAQDTSFPTGKPEIFRDHDFFLTRSPTFPTRAQKGLRNIAIQTSPSLRKHCPVFKKKKLTGSKSLTEMPTEPAHPIQVNGSLCEQDIVSADLCYLRITNHAEDGYGNGEGEGQLSQRAPKAQRNGPIYSDDSSVSEKTTASTQVPEYIHVSFPQDRNVSMDAPDTASDPSHSLLSSTVTHGTESSENSTPSSEPERAEPCLSDSANCRECDPHSAAWEAGKSDSELPVASRDGSSKETAPLSPPSNHSSSPCSLRDCHQAGEHKPDPSCVTLPGDHTTRAATSSEPPKPAPSREPGMEENSTQSDAAQWNSCSEGFHTKSYPPRSEIKPQTNQEISEINQIHLAHGELCALQGRLQSVEESLQSNQEKIKVLLNVIQDLEKSRALSEGRNFYHTGQDLNNCSTCQNTACIIYSVEYDFRQQEGRFHQILKTLDNAEQDPASASPQKPPPDPPAPEKKELRRKTKKMKRKCFWWI
ncbi:protein INSYN2B isoform X1 [Corapipo altera]|uniref:protein INSYN2B isoform X1 n=1 Tax=Corapipo altera TaxID=415028 RepID=UPI000FD651EF|nr:protein INSYN2B isoform X1 [Corapipo altera]